jgi:hypothetical protein
MAHRVAWRLFVVQIREIGKLKNDLGVWYYFPHTHSLTRSLHLFLSWARPIQSISPIPTSPRSVLILSTHLRLGLPSGLFPYGFPTNNLYPFLFSAIRATCPAQSHPPRLYYSNYTWRRVQITKLFVIFHAHEKWVRSPPPRSHLWTSTYRYKKKLQMFNY